MGKLFFASLITLSIISSFVCGAVLLALLYADSVSLVVAITWTIIINFILWLAGPWFTDWVNKWFYKTRFVTKEELAATHPEVFEIVNQISTLYKFRFPKIGIIPDSNPTAFTYGSARFNSRIVLTEGIFKFLNPQEVKAVVAHELGHIVNRDFIVMMIASTLVQILYQIYSRLIKSKGKKSGGAKLIALGVYVLYLAGIYLLYYLSRTREYLADQFSARFTDPNDLSKALIKIAYGIVTVGDSNSTQELLKSTRHLGILDVKNAKHYAVESYITHDDPNILSEVIAFDKISPWAKLSELNSTHPLTGKRIDHLSDISKAQGRPVFYDVDGAVVRMNVDKGHLYGNFFFELTLALLPYILGAYAFFFLEWHLIFAAVGLGLLIQIPFKFPWGSPVETNVLDLMRDPYASAFRGKPVALTGEVMGRGVPGYMFNEDMMYQDKTGLIFLDYTSLYGFFGNLVFALKKFKKTLGQPSRAIGWYYRGIGSTVSLRHLQTPDGKIVSHPIFWATFIPLCLFAVSLYFLATFDPNNTIPSVLINDLGQ